MGIKSTYRGLPEEVRLTLKPFIRLLIYVYHLPKRLLNSIENLYAYNIFKRAEYWTKGKHEEYQLKKLNEVVRESYKYVPYYRRLFDEHNLTPDDIQSLEDIRKIPFLTKEIVKKNIDDLISKKYKREKLLYFVTGGTTGSPMGLYQCHYNRVLELATHVYWYKYVGLDYLKSRQAVLGGTVIPENLTKDKQYWLITGNTLILSTYHISDKTCFSYVNILNEFKPSFIHAYPSAISLLARYMNKNQLKLDFKLDAIVVDAEVLYDEQKGLLINTFECPVYNFYGHYEHAVTGIPCNKSNYFHILPEFGICELIKPNGEIATEEKEEGEIVATGFACRAMPFIRYRTGDIGVLTKEKCDCGRNYMLLKSIKGRVQDYIVGADYNVISITPVLFGPPTPDPLVVRRVQFYQDTPGKVLLKVVKEMNCDKANEEIEKDLLGIYTPKFGDNCDISIEFVSNIPLAHRGKQKYLEQKLDIESFIQRIIRKEDES